MTVSTTNSYVPAVDYTSRDYASIRDDMVGLIPQYLPEWTNRDESDFGITLIELFAYLGDSLNFYLDKVGNEAFIDTAVRRESVLAIARMLDYTPTGTAPATVTLTWYNASGASAAVPAGTVVSANIVDSTGKVTTIPFTTDAAVTVPAASGGVSGSVTGTATQGVVYTGEASGTSDGSVDQDFVLFNSPVVQSSVVVYVNETGTPAIWTAVDNLLDYGPLDTVYSLYEDADGLTHVTFGDNIAGRVPAANAAITADYRTCSGYAGNVGAGTVQYIAVPVAAGVTVTNVAAATGGTDSESTDDIRVNAPASLRTIYRAVTLADYAALALKVSGVAKASAVSAVYSSVTLYVAPTGGGAPTTTLESAVSTYMADKIPASASVTVQGPTYVSIDVTVNVTIGSQYSQSAVSPQVNNAIDALFSFDNANFGDTVTVGDIISAIQTVAGPTSISVTKMAITPGTGTADIVCTANEIPALGTLSVTLSGGVA